MLPLDTHSFDHSRQLLLRRNNLTHTGNGSPCTCRVDMVADTYPPSAKHLLQCPYRPPVSRVARVHMASSVRSILNKIVAIVRNTIDRRSVTPTAAWSGLRAMTNFVCAEGRSMLYLLLRPNAVFVLCTMTFLARP